MSGIRKISCVVLFTVVMWITALGQPTVRLFIIEQNGLWGFSDASGKDKPRFDLVEEFSEGLARVYVCTKEGPGGFIDRTGAMSDFDGGRINKAGKFLRKQVARKNRSFSAKPCPR